MKRIRPDVFSILILVSAAISYFFPQLALTETIPLRHLISMGITLIFFFYGLKLNLSEIRRDLLNYRLHLVIQFTTFVLFPLLVLLARPFVASPDKINIWLSFMFLAALPSTVSSSVVLVSIARGNVPAAILNATLSGLIGIVLTPLWMGLFVSKIAADYEWGTIYLKLLTEIVLPVVAGTLLQHYFIGFHAFVRQYNKIFSRFDQFIILLIVYESFSISFSQNVFGSVDLWDLIVITIAVVVLFYAVYGLTGIMSSRMGFGYEDTIAARFAGTKKSMLHGSVFYQVIFGTSTVPMGLILLPLMLFHAFQLFVVGVIAGRKGRERAVSKH